jgi:hypothetical protein
MATRRAPRRRSIAPNFERSELAMGAPEFTATVLTSARNPSDCKAGDAVDLAFSSNYRTGDNGGVCGYPESSSSYGISTSSIRDWLTLG